MKKREILTNLFEACKTGRSATQLHSQLLKNGLIYDSFFATKLNSLYAKHFSLEIALKLFEETPQRTVYLWNSLLRSHCRENKWEATLHLFKKMVSGTTVTSDRPDNFTVPIAVKACASLSELRTGKMIHGLIKKSDTTNSDMFVGSALVELYAKCGEMGDALKVFEEFPQPDVVLWTSMVTGYERNGNGYQALAFFSRMRMTADRVTLISAVSACSQLMDLVGGKSVHGFTIRMGHETDLSLLNALLNLYGKTGSVNNAKNLFECIHEKDVISWSSMISCYVQNEKAAEGLNLFNQMVFEKRFEPNLVTIVAALQACAAACNVDEGRRIHELAIRKGFEHELSVATSLIDMYMKCSCLEKAVDIFNRMPKKDVVCWAALVSGYTQNGKADKSLNVFRNMLSDGTRPDAVIMVKILMACTEVGNLHQAHCLHGYLVSTGFDNRVFVGAALMDMYSKCGNLDNTLRVFEGMSHKDVVVWSSIIAGYGIHGLGKEAIRMFNLMIETSEVLPNHVTFLSVLSACSHTGLVEEGLKIFDDMVSKYKIEPNSEHYGAMVDLFGRVGELDKAMEFIDRMPIPSDPKVWGALLGACSIHHNIEMGEKVAKHLLELEPDHAGYYALLSNIYAVDGKWDSAEQIRALVKEKRLKRTPAQSSIDVRETGMMPTSGQLCRGSLRAPELCSSQIVPLRCSAF